MTRIIGLCALLCLFAPAAWANQSPAMDPTAIWTTWSGEARLEIRADYLPDFGLEIRSGERSLSGAVQETYPVRDLGTLTLYAPAGNFERFLDGRLQLATDLVLRHDEREVRLDQLVLTPALRDRHPVLEARDGQGRHLLTLSHIHVVAEHERELLTLHNADVEFSGELARLLDLPVLAEVNLGMAWLDLNLHIPDGADRSGIGPDDPERGLSCAGRPFWPQEGNEIDVALISIGQVAYQGTEPGTTRIKVAPSATLKSEGFGDVPWIPKFGQLGSYTYQPRDQHPFLVWNMYRIADGRIEQLAGSGVKHAFLTLNFNCTINCGSGNVLWPGCEDVYGTGTNNSNSNQGPRYDIEASEGLFFSTCSFFDPNCQSTQTNNSGNWENRLMVDTGELQTPDAEYFLDSWYVAQYDVDIWNSMGYHRINPNPAGGGWSFGPLGPFTLGPAISEWIAENDSDPHADHQVVVVPSLTPEATYPDNMPQGHVRVLVRATEVETDRWRYNYAVMNYDFDRGIDRFEVPLPAGVEVFETWFGGVEVDGEPGTPWTVEIGPDAVVFQAPVDNPLSWFNLYNFEVELDSAPAVDGMVLLGAAGDVAPGEIEVSTVAPGTMSEIIFADAFES